MSGIDRTRAAGGVVWAVTVYFNPMRYARRRENYHVFRERLGVPLVAIELAYGGAFDLGASDADVLVQIPGRDVLWQKERLMNVALRAVPRDVRKIVFVDCDVIFEQSGWVERLSDALDRWPLVQPFSRLHRMAPGWTPADARPAGAEMLRTPGLMLREGVSLYTCLGSPAEQIKCSTGSAWGVDRGLLERHGFYDACVVGGGDSAFVRAAYGCFDEAMRLQHMHARRREHYLMWARPFFDEVRGRTSFLDGDLLHLWHGTPQDRRYRRRNEGLEPFEFDPFVDIAIDPHGAWRWSSDKPAMHDDVRGYFASRREDG